MLIENTTLKASMQTHNIRMSF